MCRTSRGTSTRWSTARAPTGPTACSPRPTSARRRSPSATRGTSPSSTGPGSPGRWPSSQAIAELVGARRQLRAPALRRRHDRPGERRARRARQREGDRDRDEAPVLRPRVGRARRRARRRAARRRRPRHEPPPPAHGPPLPAAPPHRARGEDHDREGGHRPRGVVAPVLGADERDQGRHAGRRGAGQARRRAEPAAVARPRAAPHDRRGRHGRARAEPAHARLHLQHARPGQGDRRPPARLPELDLEPQPRQRGERRVGPGARRGGALATTTCRSAGTR